MVYDSFKLFYLFCNFRLHESCYYLYCGIFNSKKVLSISLLIVAYTAYKGLKPLSKINEYVGYIILIMILFSGAAIKYGSIMNLKPVLQAPIKDILKGSIDSLYFFTAFESLLLYHNRVKDKSSIKKASFKGLLISTIVWIWSILITIYYLGVDIIPKSNWSFLMVFESIHLPIINNFRYVFMFAWTLICLRIVGNFYYFTSFILSDVTKLDRKKICIALYIPVLFITNKLGDSIVREKLITLLSPIFVIFNICFLTILAFIVYFKSKKTTNQNN
ncbi:GerAB/ArcD/ProY family transporter [Haloimpatiens lingqiaonensis]|uniref:GerAB/ArcD/ProY family transporter n=1 Tax=Haloimpatiens lingqiaonensis TaxID=1380675 RepID=UPI0037C163DA